MEHETTPAPPRQPWQAPRLVEQPDVNTATGGTGILPDGTFATSSS